MAFHRDTSYPSIPSDVDSAICGSSLPRQHQSDHVDCVIPLSPIASSYLDTAQCLTTYVCEVGIFYSVYITSATLNCDPKLPWLTPLQDARLITASTTGHVNNKTAGYYPRLTSPRSILAQGAAQMVLGCPSLPTLFWTRPTPSDVNHCPIRPVPTLWRRVRSVQASCGPIYEGIPCC